MLLQELLDKLEGINSKNKKVIFKCDDNIYSLNELFFCYYNGNIFLINHFYNRKIFNRFISDNFNDFLIKNFYWDYEITKIKDLKRRFSVVEAKNMKVYVLLNSKIKIIDENYSWESNFNYKEEENLITIYLD